MIKREDLKKGDMVLVVPNSDFTRNEFASPARVVSIGPKYISVATRWDEDNYFPPDKFNNDKNMFEKDYSSRRLFLGTEEEYEKYKNEEKKANELYFEIERKVSRNLGYEKLLAIKTIIEADSVDEALAEMHCVRLPR